MYTKLLWRRVSSFFFIALHNWVKFFLKSYFNTNIFSRNDSESFLHPKFEDRTNKKKINEIKNALSKNKSPHCALCALRLYVKIVFLYTQWDGILL